MEEKVKTYIQNKKRANDSLDKTIKYKNNFNLSLNNLYIGESVKWMQDNLPSNFIDLTITSPPYDNLRDYKGFDFDYKAMLKELYRVTKDGGVVVWIVGDATIDGSETGTSFRQALYAIEAGFNLHDTMIYEKNGMGACGSNKCYLQNFEYMFVLSKEKINTFNLIYDRENVSVGKMKVNSRRNIHTADTERQYNEITTKKYGRRFNIWKYNQTDGHDKYSVRHSAPFPEHLAKDHILSWSNEGDLVFDPMCGSGTTCKMAYLNNRNFIGIDISKEYINDICVPRLKKYGWNNVI